MLRRFLVAAVPSRLRKQETQVGISSSNSSNFWLVGFRPPSPPPLPPPGKQQQPNRTDLTGGQPGRSDSASEVRPEGPGLTQRIDQARQAASGGDYASALGLLREAIQAFPNEMGLRQLLLDTEKASRRDEAESKRRSGIAESVQRIESKIASGEADIARQWLQESMELWGRDPV